MVIKRDVRFTPTGETRTLHIWLPDDYDETDEKYPVMYWWDGHNLYSDSDATYGKCWGLADFMRGWEKKMIHVGIECSHVGRNRLTEYCPYHFRSGFLGDLDGTGIATVDWVISEVKPLIDREYRTWPFRECTAIGGSSMGGLMSLWTVVNRNSVFSKAACVSSTIGPCMEDFRRDISAADIDPDTRVYLSWGTEEGGGSPIAPGGNARDELYDRNEELAERIAAHGAAARIYAQEGGHHCEADWEKQVPSFMDFLWLNR